MSGWLGSKREAEEEVAKAKEQEAQAKRDLAEAKRTAEAQAEEDAAAKEADAQIRQAEEARLAQVEADAAATRRAEMVQMKEDEKDAAHQRTAEAKEELKGDDTKPKRRRKSPKTYEDLIADGWSGLTIKAGNTRSMHDVAYDPSTHKMEVADGRFGANGIDLEESDDEVPEIRIEEDRQGGWLAMDEAVDHDITTVVRVVPEIRK